MGYTKYIQGLQKKGAAGDEQPAGSGGGLEALCRSAGEKLQAGLYTGMLPADKRERWHGGWG